jgi:hypothetical protein
MEQWNWEPTDWDHVAQWICAGFTLFFFVLRALIYAETASLQAVARSPAAKARLRQSGRKPKSAGAVDMIATPAALNVANNPALDTSTAEPIDPSPTPNSEQKTTVKSLEPLPATATLQRR